MGKVQTFPIFTKHNPSLIHPPSLGMETPAKNGSSLSFLLYIWRAAILKCNLDTVEVAMVFAKSIFKILQSICKEVGIALLAYAHRDAGGVYFPWITYCGYISVMADIHTVIKLHLALSAKHYYCDLSQIMVKCYTWCLG